MLSGKLVLSQFFVFSQLLIKSNSNLDPDYTAASKGIQWIKMAIISLYLQARYFTIAQHDIFTMVQIRNVLTKHGPSFRMPIKYSSQSDSEILIFDLCFLIYFWTFAKSISTQYSGLRTQKLFDAHFMGTTHKAFENV
jgi:hypothetical protein